MHGTGAVQTCADMIRVYALLNDQENLILWTATARHIARLLDSKLPPEEA